MAIGIAKIMGLDLPRNFDHPYLSLSMTEFWRRWHITLGNWFKEYASGAKDDRVELNRLLSIVKESDEIYCVDPSRLTRSLKYLLQVIRIFSSNPYIDKTI